MIKITPRRRRVVTAEEHSLWRMVTRDTEPLPGRAPVEPDTPAPAAAPPPAAIPSAAPALPGNPAAPSRRPSLPGLAPSASPGLDRRTDDRLRRGRLNIDGRIDLHGMTQTQAHSALHSFILRGWHE